MAIVPVAFLAWLKRGRDIVPFGSVLSIAFHILGQLGLYPAKLLNKTDAPCIVTDRT